MSLGNVVTLLVRARVAVGVADKRKGRVDRDGLGRVHEVVARVLDNLAVFPELGVVLEGEQDSARGPRELVAERVVGSLGGGESSTVGQEGEDLKKEGEWEEYRVLSAKTTLAREKYTAFEDILLFDSLFFLLPFHPQHGPR